MPDSSTFNLAPRLGTSTVMPLLPISELFAQFSERATLNRAIAENIYGYQKPKYVVDSLIPKDATLGRDRCVINWKKPE